MLMLFPASGWACTKDFDCGAGSRCLKSTGAIYGTCARDVLDVQEKSLPISSVPLMDKHRCDFDADCEAGRTCMKASANAPGMCVKRK